MSDNVSIDPGESLTVDVATDELAGGEHVQYVKLMDGTADSETVIKADEITASLVTITYEHHEVHEGDSFTCSRTVDLAQSASTDLLIVTPDTTKYAHFGWQVHSEVEAHVSLWEGVTATAAANPVVAYNRERNAGGAATVVVTHSPTSITTGSTLIREAHFGTGRTAGGTSHDAEEFILKRNTKYLFRVTNAMNNASNYVSIRLNWYEHTSL